MKFFGMLLAMAFALVPFQVRAQSTCPPIKQDYVLTPGQWQSCFSAKQDTLNFTPVNSAGGTLTGKLVTTPSSTTQAGFSLYPGVAPSAPIDGDVWTTGTGMYVRISGSTIGPLGTPAPNTASANTVYAGPTSGPVGPNTFRALVPDDLPIASTSDLGAVRPDNTTITVSSGVLTAVGAAATTIESGTTNVLNATSGNCLYDNAGVLGDSACLRGVNIQNFDTAGAATYTPSSGLRYAKIECVGAGGAGGGANGSSGNSAGGGGGGGGAYSMVIADAATIGASQSITVGAGGTGSTGPGTTGGDTNVGALCVAKGGFGGGAGTNSPANGGQSGSPAAGTGTVKFGGNGGAPGFGNVGSTAAIGGTGGGSVFAGGAYATSNTGGGQAGRSCGGGGGGGAVFGAASVNGGGGAAGCVIITEYLQ